jgi:hypothetical protein
VDELRKLKKLPAGWDVLELVADDSSAKMFRKMDLDDGSVTKLFQKLMDDTKRDVITLDRKKFEGATAKVASSFCVEKAEMVQNAESWFSYCKKKEHIIDQCKVYSTEVPLSRDRWKTMSGEIFTAVGNTADELLKQTGLPPLSKDANEFLLMHGTKADVASLIAENHFDMAFACKTGMLGAGLYFAESSTKSDEYVKPNAKNHFPIIFARVTLGRINYCDKPDPSKDPGRDKLEVSCLSGSYHSVLGDRIKARNTYREYVVYDHFQVYPQFVVWYSRK